jgi:hypothetical protein
VLQSGSQISAAAQLGCEYRAQGCNERRWGNRSGANRTHRGMTARRVTRAALVVMTCLTRAFFHIGVCVMSAKVVNARKINTMGGLRRGGGHHRVMQHARVRVHSKAAEEGDQDECAQQLRTKH